MSRHWNRRCLDHLRSCIDRWIRCRFTNFAVSDQSDKVIKVKRPHRDEGYNTRKRLEVENQPYQIPY